MVTQPPLERLSRLIEEGYSTFSPERPFATCDRWIEGWALLESGPVNGARSSAEMDRTCRLETSVSEWLNHLEQALGFAGDRRPEYHEHRVRFCRALRRRFPDENPARMLWFYTAESDSLMKLGREDEADEALTAGIERYPDEVCGYVGWADRHLYRSRTGRPEFKTAETILKGALARPGLKHPDFILVRLAEVYHHWGRTREARRILKELRGRPSQLFYTLAASRIEDNGESWVTGDELPGLAWKRRRIRGHRRRAGKRKRR